MYYPLELQINLCLNRADALFRTKAARETVRTRKRAIAKALQLQGHPDFASVDLAYYQHFLGFFVRKYCVLGRSAWQPQMQITWRHAPCQR